MSPRTAHLTAIPFLEDLVFTGLSLVVLVALVAGVFMQPQATIAFAAPKPAGGGGGGGPNSQFEVLYGALKDDSGAPIAGATISVSSPTKAVTTATTAADGTFRIRFKDVGGPYSVTVTYVANGQTVTGTKVVDMQPGFSYGLNATITVPSTFLWIALPIY